MPEIDKLKMASDLQDVDFENWLTEEHQFLQDLKEEPQTKVLECAYSVHTSMPLKQNRKPSK